MSKLIDRISCLLPLTRLTIIEIGARTVGLGEFLIQGRLGEFMTKDAQLIWYVMLISIRQFGMCKHCFSFKADLHTYGLSVNEIYH